MNYPIKTDSTFIGKIIFDETSEQTVDSDFGLPDYCPDILKILKCRIEPHIDSKNIIADRIEIEGTAVVRIIYVDAIKMAVRCTEQSFPYSISGNLKSAPDNAVIQTDIKVSYLNCRALSPRRLNIHGVIRSDAVITKGEYTPVLGKLMYKGELLVKLLYLTDLDNGKTDSMEYAIPFSQVIDLGGITDDSKLAVRADVMSQNITLRTEIGFDDPLPVFTAKISLTAFSYSPAEMTIISDCYSTMYNTKKETDDISLPQTLGTIRESITEKTNIDLTDNTASKVIDVWCETSAAVLSEKDGKHCICGKYNICLLARDSDDSIFCTERTVEYSHVISTPESAGKLTAFLDSSCISAGYRICSDKRIEVRAEIFVTGELYGSRTEKCITSLTSDENSPRANTSGTVVLYFADKGESVWDIAGHYCTSADKILSENDLENDVLTESRILMITG